MIEAYHHERDKIINMEDLDSEDDISQQAF